MRDTSNLPPGCTSAAVERQIETFDSDDETDCAERYGDGPDPAGVPCCFLGETYCRKAGPHRHCAECGGDHADGCCEAPEYSAGDGEPAL